MPDKQLPLVSDALVKTGASPTDKESAIREAGELLFLGGYVERPYIESMLAREKVANTFLGAGVAIPHGKVEDKGYVKSDGISVLQVPGGVEWNPGQTVRLVVGIAARSDGHLAILRRLTRLINEETLIERLSTTEDRSLLTETLSRESADGEKSKERVSDLDVKLEWTLDYPSGLHARPASLWVNAAQSWEGPLQIRRGDETADPRNLVSLLQLGIKAGDTIVISADGLGAEETVRRFRDTMASLSAQEKDDFEKAAQRAERAAKTRKNAWMPPSGRTPLAGVSASPGLAIGKVLKVFTRKIDTEDEPASLLESAKFLDAAIDEVKRPCGVSRSGWCRHLAWYRARPSSPSQQSARLNDAHHHL